MSGFGAELLRNSSEFATLTDIVGHPRICHKDTVVNVIGLDLGLGLLRFLQVLPSTASIRNLIISDWLRSTSQHLNHIPVSSIAFSLLFTRQICMRYQPIFLACVNLVGLDI